MFEVLDVSMFVPINNRPKKGANTIYFNKNRTITTSQTLLSILLNDNEYILLIKFHKP
jgi:hypothetical protein